MSISNKIKWVLGILLVFFLIITTNLIDRHAFERVKDSITSIYDDRLVAKEIIFELLLLIQEKEIANVSNDVDFYSSRNKVINEQIDGLNTRFLTTKLTLNEKRTFETMQANFQVLKNQEQKKLQAQTKENQVNCATQLSKIRVNLQTLSKIQMAEGQRQLSITKEEFDNVDLYTKIEVYFLIFLAILIQIVILYKPLGAEENS